MRATLLALTLLAPCASALDVFPGHETWGAHDARILVRLPDGGTLTIRADAPVRASVVTPGALAGAGVPLPATFHVESRHHRDSWHGLPGTVEVVLTRDDPQHVVVEVMAEDGTGAVYDWPDGARKTPGAAWPAAVALALIVRRAMTGAAA